MNHKSYDYLVIWQPLNPVHTVEQMRVIDVFSSTLTLADVRDQVEAAAAKGEYSWQMGEGLITVVTKPDHTYRVLAKRYFAKKYSDASHG
jgi:hypothetical protein